jgi:hypothetical protein
MSEQTPQPISQDTPQAMQPTEQATSQPSDESAAHPTEQAKPASPRKDLLKRIGGVLLAVVVFFGFRVFTSDDGTHGVQVGDCIAAEGTDDFTKVDCTGSDVLGTVTFIQKDTSTTESAALALCDKHGAQGAFTSADVDGGTGTVLCVADSK